MNFWLNYINVFEDIFPCLAIIVIPSYLGFLVFGLKQQKIALNEKKPTALYHFTSKTCLDKIATCGVIESVNYGVIFSTSNKRKKNRGRSCNPLKRKGVIVFLDESLDCFKVNFCHGLLRLIFLYKFFQINHQEYITKSYGNLHLYRSERVNNYILLVRRSRIEPCNKKVHFIRRLKSLIKQYCDISFCVLFLCAFLSVLAMLTNVALIKTIMVSIFFLYGFIGLFLLCFSGFLGKIDNIK